MARSTYAPISRARLILLVLFVGGVIGITYVQLAYAIPRRNCEASGRWWSMRYRECATPIRLGRPAGRAPAAPTRTTQPSAPASAASAIPADAGR